MGFSKETRIWAKELYVIEGLSLEEVSEETEIPLGTLKRWSSEEQWFDEKQRHRRELVTIDQDTLKLKKLMTKHAIETLDPQVIHALNALNKIKISSKKADQKEPDIDRPKIFLEDLEFIAETLREIDPEGLKVVSRDFEMIVRRFKESHAQAA